MSILHIIVLTVLVTVLLILVGILAYDSLVGRNGRYVAKDLNWTFIGVPTGVVEDTTPNEPSTLNRTGAGWEHVTTLSNARAIARWANRNEGK